MKNLIKYITNHSQEAREVEGKLEVLEVWTMPDSPEPFKEYKKWITIEPTYDSVREWLGY